MKDLFFTAAGKALKSEYWTVTLGLLAASLATKLGIPEEEMQSFFLAITGMVTTYIGGRTYAKGKAGNAG